MKKNRAAQALGKLGGIGRAKALSPAEMSKAMRKAAKGRMKKMTAAQRSAVARKAVAARIKKYKQQRRMK